MKASYTIADEPTPGGLAHLTVQPFFPLLAVMFGGTWLSWPWFAVNGFAMGSPTRNKELATVIGGFVLMIIAAAGALATLGAELMSVETFRYMLLVPVTIKLFISYRLYLLQSRTFELYQYFGGLVRNGILVVVAGYFLRSYILPDPDTGLGMLLFIVLA